MEENSIGQLRRKQLLFINLALGIIFFIIPVFAVFEIKLFYLTLFSLVVLLVTFVEQITKVSFLDKFFPFMKAIEEHEKEKLGIAEHKKQKRVVIISEVVVIFVLMLQVESMYHQAVVMDFPMAVFILITLLVLGLVINIAHFLRVRKIDRAPSPENLKGYTMKSLAVQISVGVIIGFLLTVGIITWAIHSSAQW
ncbi:hypothetical protein FIU87_14030 [Bacillus sp. THAF10]|uniref:hypothetical protein n=1 Tax=Bacillus sp. THAF10 TaxID=2587848 RepID=UPI001268E45D|nr:hypothetical protein [Bacillus sp. THAF10]QFT89777.1 hypothetical protein FIU87_14030 [Bacillus sp. THAF10]